MRPTPIEHRTLVVVLVAVSASASMALNVILPSLPGLQRAFGADYATVQLVLTLYSVGFAVAQLVYGPVSDRFGRRPPMLVGLALFLVGTATCALAPTIEVLIFGRVLQAVGGCAGMVLSRAIVRDVYERDEAATVIAYVIMAMVVAPMLAPLVGGYLEVAFGWRASFVFVLVFGAIVFAIAATKLRETHHGERLAIAPRALGRNFAVLVRQPAFWRYTAQTSFSTSTFFAYIAGAPYVLIELMGRPPTEYGWWSLLVSAGFMTGNFFAARYSRRSGIDRIIAVGTAIGVASAAVFAALTAMGHMSALALFGTMAGVAVGQGMSIPNGSAGAVSVDPKRAGSASGLAGFLQMGAGAATTAIVGSLMTTNAVPLAVALVALTLAAAGSHHALGVLAAKHEGGEGGQAR